MHQFGSKYSKTAAPAALLVKLYCFFSHYFDLDMDACYWTPR